MGRRNTDPMETYIANPKFAVKGRLIENGDRVQIINSNKWRSIESGAWGTVVRHGLCNVRVLLDDGRTMNFRTWQVEFAKRRQARGLKVPEGDQA